MMGGTSQPRCSSVHKPCHEEPGDVHTIQSMPIHQQLAFFLEHFPPQTRLLIATREDPPLPLARLRTRDQVTDIRQADLNFTGEEAAGFLQPVMDLDLSPAEVDTLNRRTEGSASRSRGPGTTSTTRSRKPPCGQQCSCSIQSESQSVSKIGPVEKQTGPICCGLSVDRPEAVSRSPSISLTFSPILRILSDRNQGRRGTPGGVCVPCL